MPKEAVKSWFSFAIKVLKHFLEGGRRKGHVFWVPNLACQSFAWQQQCWANFRSSNLLPCSFLSLSLAVDSMDLVRYII
jgi:hypothetical protein